LTLADVKSKYEGDLNRICDALRIPYETAVLAMRQFNWYALRFGCMAVAVTHILANLSSLQGCSESDGHLVRGPRACEETRRTSWEGWHASSMPSNSGVHDLLAALSATECY
jgi:hypothetical protein